VKIYYDCHSNQGLRNCSVPVLDPTTDTARGDLQIQENQCYSFRKSGKAEDLLRTYKLVISFHTW